MKRLIPFVILIVLLLAGILAVPFLLRPESHRAEITEALSKLLKKPVVIGQISLGYWPPTLRLGRVAVLREGGEPILQIEEVAGPLDWASLFHLKLVPRGLQMNRWSLTVSRQTDGSWDLADWLSQTPDTSGAKRWPIDQVSWKAGELHAVDRYASVPQELVLSGMEGSWVSKEGTINTSGTFSGIGSPARLTLNAKGTFFSSPQWTGDLQLLDGSNACTFHVEKRPGNFDIKGGAAKWRLTNALALLKFYGRGMATAVNSANLLTLENWQLHASGDAGHVSFEHTAGISGGISEAKGTLVRQPAGLLAHVDAALKNVAVEAILGLTGETVPLEGNVTGLTKGFELFLSSRTSSSLKGQGVWELKDGHYRLPEISLNKLARAKSMPYLKKKFPDLAQKGIPVNRLSAHWQAKDGMISVDDGFLATTDIKAAWVGKLDVARQGLDGFLQIQFHEKDPALAPLVPARYRTQPANGRLQGTWQEWFLRAVSSSKIPAGVQSKLRKAIKQQAFPS